jgi:hypothetical protein
LPPLAIVGLIGADRRRVHFVVLAIVMLLFTWHSLTAAFNARR